MRIENIHIAGFGVWSEKDWNSLAPGINLFYGPNEAGKSTLMAFVRAILFGFERRGGARRYEPVSGGAHGGWLDLNVAGSRLRIERKPGRSVRGTVVVTDETTSAGEERLEALLAGTTRTLYHNVFAFGLEELEHFHTLEEHEVAQHIAGAGLGVGAARWSSVQRDLEDRESALFLSRGQSGTINAALKELEAARSDLERTEHQPRDYWTAREARSRLESEAAALEEALIDAKQRAARYEKRVNAKPARERRNRIDAQLDALPKVDQFPEGGVERLALLDRQREDLRTELGQIDREIARRRGRKGEISPMIDPADYARRARILEALRSLGPKLDATRRLERLVEDRRAAAARNQESLAATCKRLRPPSMAAFLTFIGILWAGAAGFVALGRPPILAGIAIGVSLIPLIWYRKRAADFVQSESRARDARETLESASRERESARVETQQIEGEIRKLIGKSEIVAEDIDLRSQELERLAAIAEEGRRLDAAIEHAKAEADRVRRQMETVRQAVATLLEEAGAASEADLLERAEVFKRRRELLFERDRIPPDPETGLLFDMGLSEEEAYESASHEALELELRLNETRRESGRIEERIAIMERSEERARALTKQEAIVERIDSAADKWAVIALCRALLDETRRVYEAERQPQVLRHASSFFATMTGGRYIRAIAPLDGTEIQVERADGVRLAPSMLSRGTAEQLYLAMRLALAREYANHVEPLPLVFDDVFVNFDPTRIRGTIQAVRELAESHQAMIFTCHPHVVALFEEIVPGLTVFPLQ
ncbi:MAG TPA: AAA family ATPase [Terriglobia bacterium]|nr:AAA family ATPase [Terriglobia bacterium]